MDPETRDALERLERNLREEVQGQVAGTRSHFEVRLAETRDGLEARIAETRDSLEARIAETRDSLEARIAESEDRTRRHFDVVGEALRGDIRLLADGVTAFAEASTRRDTEIHGRIDRVEHRVLGLESRVSALEAARSRRWRRR